MAEVETIPETEITQNPNSTIEITGAFGERRPQPRRIRIRIRI